MSPSRCSWGTSVSSACDVGGETREVVGLEGTDVELTLFATMASVTNAGGDAYEIWPKAALSSASLIACDEALLVLDASQYVESKMTCSLACPLVVVDEGAAAAAALLLKFAGFVTGEVLLSCFGLLLGVGATSPSVGRDRLFVLVTLGFDRSWALSGSILPCSSCMQRRCG